MQGQRILDKAFPFRFADQDQFTCKQVIQQNPFLCGNGFMVTDQPVNTVLVLNLFLDFLNHIF